MVILSWLDEGKRQDVYQMYLELMVEQDKEFKTTSHEYVMRVIAEKFNLTPMRVAAIVQNCHDEEQVAKEGGMVNDKLAAYVDARIKEHINNAYMAYGEVNPNEFVESPTGVADIGGDSGGEVVRVEDLYNVDDLLMKAVVREEGEAQLLIDEKVYIEDVDSGKVASKANAECLTLVQKAQDEFKVLRESLNRNEGDKIEFSLPDGGTVEGEDGNSVKAQRRPRWKYAAQTINVREQKKIGKNSRRGGKLQKKHQKANTLVEENGELRIATLEEVGQTAWKSVRNEHEFTYKGVKAAWLNRQLKGEKLGWGRVPAAPKPKVEEEVVVAEEPATEETDAGEESGDAPEKTESDEEKK